MKHILTIILALFITMPAMAKDRDRNRDRDDRRTERSERDHKPDAPAQTVIANPGVQAALNTNAQSGGVVNSGYAAAVAAARATYYASQGQ